MDLEHILARALREPVTKEEALFLLRRASED